MGLFTDLTALAGNEHGDPIHQLEYRISRLEGGILSAFTFCCCWVSGDRPGGQKLLLWKKAEFSAVL